MRFKESQVKRRLKNTLQTKEKRELTAKVDGKGLHERARVHTLMHTD